MDKLDIYNIPSIILTRRLISDLEMITNGGFSPLKTFLNKKDYQSVLTDMRLMDGSFWPLPIVLPINKKDVGKIEKKGQLILKDHRSVPIAWMNVKEIYKPNLEKECKLAYGTTDLNHPYVRLVLDNQEKFYVSGEIKMLENILDGSFSGLKKTPEELKKDFALKGWKNIIGFQTRNPIHKSHFHATINALKEVGKDARLLINPVTGETQDGDIDPHIRIKCYREIMNYYPKDMAMLSLLPLSMRMAGPREALMHALIRKNYGCTHFIVGREHAQPSFKDSNGKNFYGPFDAYDLSKNHEKDLGIQIIRGGMVAYVLPEKRYRDVSDKKLSGNKKICHISGTEIRRRLNHSLPIPSWFTFPKIRKILKEAFPAKHQTGLCLYIVGLSGSGKSTLAQALELALKEIDPSRKITLLDGDEIRRNLSSELGFSRQDRSKNIRRIGYVASEIVKHQGIAICANIAPFEEDRLYNRELISKHGEYVEIFLDTPLSVCQKRDPKGLYKAAKKGQVKKMTGVSDSFEKPEKSDLVLDGNQNLSEEVHQVISFLRKQKIIK